MTPYTGPRWYPKVSAEFLLFHGIVTWEDIHYGLDASAHLPKDALVETLNFIERGWAGSYLAKASINAMLGFMGSPRTSS